MRWRTGGDDGSAVVEFVTLGVLLLVPVVYLVVALGRVQAGSFAAEAAAREAARALSAAEDEASGTTHAHAAALLAFRDQGFADVDISRALVISCSAEPCLTPQAPLTVLVNLDVVLPGVPAFVDAVVPTRVSVRADATAVVDRFRT